MLNDMEININMRCIEMYGGGVRATVRTGLTLT